MSKTYAAVSPQRVAFIGLGVMGFPMAKHLQCAGHQVTVYNRSPAKAARWVEQWGGASAATPRQAAAGAHIVFCCVGNDDDLRSVVLDEQGAFAGMHAGAILVDHTTTSATVARELYAEARRRDLHFVDAPVSGGQAGAENGTLTVMCGGDEAAIAAMSPIATAYAQTVTRIGTSGSGQLAKMVNQIAIAGLLQGLSEALHFGQNAGLDMPLVLDVIGKGAARSWQMENRGKTMLAGEFDFGFAVDWMRKDLGLVLEQARTIGATLPVTALVDQYYAEVQARGGGRWDTSSLITRLNDSENNSEN